MFCSPVITTGKVQGVTFTKTFKCQPLTILADDRVHTVYALLRRSTDDKGYLVARLKDNSVSRVVKYLTDPGASPNGARDGQRSGGRGREAKNGHRLGCAG